MKDRIRFLRKVLDLTMEEFGARIGMNKSSVSKIEKGVNGTTDQTVRSICREFGVNEAWLRTGSGEMFADSRQSTLERLAKEYHLSAREQAMVAAFLKLSAAEREVILRYVDTVAASASSNPNFDIDAEVEAYRQELLRQEKAEESASASAGSAAV